MLQDMKYILFILITSLGISTVFSQDGIPKKPKKETSVYDVDKVLSAVQKTSLEQKLIRYNDSTSTQIVVAIVPTINGKNIALFATEWAHKWGIGQKGKDNGVFILVAYKDRELTIRTGYGIEHLLTDAHSRRIIELVIKPEFKQGQYYRGLDKGTTFIINALNGEYKADFKPKNSGFPVIIFIIIFIIIILIITNKGNRGGRRNATDSLSDIITLSNLGRGGFGGGSSGSGSFGGGFSGGFGGGGFGGGGASGSW